MAQQFSNKDDAYTTAVVYAEFNPSRRIRAEEHAILENFKKTWEMGRYFWVIIGEILEILTYYLDKIT